MASHIELAQKLGYAGLIPFVLMAAAVWFLPENNALTISQHFIAYSAIILSFISCLLWSAALFSQTGETTNQQKKQWLVISISFSLIAWLSLMLPQDLAIWVLMAGYYALLRYEKSALHDTYPDWFHELRHWLSNIVLCCHLSVAVFLLVTS